MIPGSRCSTDGAEDEMRRILIENNDSGVKTFCKKIVSCWFVDFL